MQKIDFHAHYLTPSYKAYVLAEYNEPTPAWNVEMQLSMNQKNDIVYSLMGISTPYFKAYDLEKNYRAVQANNDEIAGLTKPHEKELGVFGHPSDIGLPPVAFGNR